MPVSDRGFKKSKYQNKGKGKIIIKRWRTNLLFSTSVEEVEPICKALGVYLIAQYIVDAVDGLCIYVARLETANSS